MALTKQQTELIQRLNTGDITVREALDQGGFPLEKVAQVTRLPKGEIEERLDEQIKDLPFKWKLKLRTAAMRLGLQALAS